MNITLRPEVEALVRDQLSRGRFASIDAVIEAAMVQFANADENLVLTPAELDSLRAELAVGIDQLDRGEGVPWDVASIRRKGQQLLDDRKSQTR